MNDPFTDLSPTSQTEPATRRGRSDWRRTLGLLKPNFVFAWILTLGAAILVVGMTLTFQPPLKQFDPENGIFHVWIVAHLSVYWWLTCHMKFKYPHEMATEQQIGYFWIITTLAALHSTQLALISRSQPINVAARQQLVIVLGVGVGWCMAIWQILRKHAIQKATKPDSSPFD